MVGKWSWATELQETPQQLISSRKPHPLTGSTTFQSSSNSQQGIFPIQISVPAVPLHPLCNGHPTSCVFLSNKPTSSRTPASTHPLAATDRRLGSHDIYTLVHLLTHHLSPYHCFLLSSLVGHPRAFSRELLATGACWMVPLFYPSVAFPVSGPKIILLKQNDGTAALVSCIS